MNADIVIATFVATIVLLILSAFAIIFTIIYKKKQQAYLAEKQLLKVRFQEELLKSQLEIKEDTLRHIAYEIHDNLGQVASLIKINLNTLALNDTLKAAEKVNDTKDLVRQLIADLKTLSVSLNSDRVVVFGLEKSLETEIERLNKTGQFKASFISSGSIPPLEDNTSIILFRMTQEILNNTVKHSKAKHINVNFHGSKNIVTLVCSDDGIGFEVANKMQSGGSGLLNLNNRARLINAQLHIQSSPQSGTTVSIELPVNG